MPSLVGSEMCIRDRVLLEILGFIVSCDFTFIRLIDFTTDIVFKPIIST